MNKSMQKIPVKGRWPFHALSRALLAGTLCLLLHRESHAQQPDKKLDADFSNAPLKEVFAKIETGTGYMVNYSRSEVKDETKVTLHLKQGTARDLIAAALKGTAYGFAIDGNIIIVKVKPKTAAVAGKLTGSIVDEESGDPVVGATIRIGARVAISDVDGTYTFVLPKGDYKADVSSVGYGVKQVTDIIVADEVVLKLNITLHRGKGQLEGVVVKASAKRESIEALYVRQKNAVGITDGISAEQIDRTPDKNVAETLKRISGLSSLDNKYVVVRGMSERYNQAMMNGQMMPSTELNRKNFSYDLIPTNIVDNVIVTKTITPDQSAEFGGGLVQINTRDIPVENFMTVSVGTVVNNKTTGKNFQSPKIDNSIYLGSVPDSKKLFGSMNYKTRADILNSGHFSGTGFNDRPLKDSAAMPNNWGLYNYKPLPSVNAQFSIGRVIPLSVSRKLGIIASVSYRNTWQTQDIRMSRDGYGTFDSPDELYGFTGHRYGLGVNTGALAGIGYRTGRHKISLQSMWLRTLDKQFITGTGNNDFAGPGSIGYNDLFTATNLWQTQLKSEHALWNKGARLAMSVNYTLLDLQKPDNHQANFTTVAPGKEDPTDPHTDFSVISAFSSGVSAGALRWWSRALEKNLGWNADLSVPFRFKASGIPVTNTLKTGYAGWRKDRLFWVFITGSQGFTGPDPEPLSETFDPKDGGVIYSPRFGDDFHRVPSLHAGYVMMDNKIGNKLRLVWGARMEYYNLNNINAVLDTFVKNQRAGNMDKTDYSALYNRESNWNFFPSANLTYSLTPKMNLRLAYSKSIIRPDLREISFFREYDFELGGSYEGNAPIISTKINHYDFRYEWYPSAGEIFSVSLFYKKLLYPMEIAAQQNKLFWLVNDKDAINKGVEAEFRKSLAFTKVPVIKNLTLYGNFTRLFATVRTMHIDYNQVDPVNLNKLVITEQVGEAVKRPQAGASNFIYNAGVYYDAKAFSVSANYNQISNRFYRLGGATVPDLYEQPMKPLDIQVAVKVLAAKGTVKLNVSNLLNSRYIIYSNRYNVNGGFLEIPPDGRQPTTKELQYQKGVDLLDYEAAPGRTYSLSFSYNF